MTTGEQREDQDFGGIRVSCADWPVVLIEFPEKRVPDAALYSMFEYLESSMLDAAKAHEQVYTLADISLMREMTPASQRRYTAEWIKRNADLVKVSSVGGATVTPSPVLRGIITAVYWIQPPIRTMFTVATRQEGMLKGIELLQREGQLLSPRLIAYRDRYGRARAV
jgi:hypothetical protein